jgi:hypothetical protein
MSKTDQFWQYAKEAILSVGGAKTDEDKQGLLELARTWTQAALQERARARRDPSGPLVAATKGQADHYSNRLTSSAFSLSRAISRSLRRR